jgi:hypothetical protein
MWAVKSNFPSIQKVESYMKFFQGVKHLHWFSELDSGDTLSF